MQRYTIQAMIYPGDEGGYVGECLDLAVVTQGKTLDETALRLSCYNNKRSSMDG